MTYPGTQAVRRAVQLLKALRDDRPEHQLGELATRAGLNKTTAFRLLAALEREGLVARGPSASGYRLGHETIALGARALGSMSLRSGARASLDALAAEVGETATLDLLIDNDVVLVDQVPARRIIQRAAELGARYPAHATAAGKVLLAFRPDPAIFPTLSRYTDRTITSHEALEKELGIVRARGYAVSEEELEEGYVDVSAPIRDWRRVVAALSAGGPAARLSRERIPVVIDAVRTHAEAISASLGAAVPDEGD